MAGPPIPTSVDFHFDVMCPFAYQTSKWIRSVREQTGLTINWRFFSLEEMIAAFDLAVIVVVGYLAAALGAHHRERGIVLLLAPVGAHHKAMTLVLGGRRVLRRVHTRRDVAEHGALVVEELGKDLLAVGVLGHISRDLGQRLA